MAILMEGFLLCPHLSPRLRGGRGGHSVDLTYHAPHPRTVGSSVPDPCNLVAE